MRWMWLAVAAVACGGGDKCKESVEIPYDGEDQDCDGADLIDVDEDGYPGTGDVDFDCDDEDASVHPDAPEVPYDGVDQNCFEGDLVDQDGDGSPAIAAGGEDCNDDDSRVRPNADDQVGDGVDLNCDGIDGVDADGDGWPSVQSRGTDCDDQDADTFPGADEVWYDGRDQDCAADCDYDQDGDGAVQPGAPLRNGDACDREAGPSVGAPQDCDDENGDVGAITVLSLSPADGAIEVPVGTDVTVVLSGPDPTASLQLRDGAGQVVSGTTSSADDATWVWSGAADLSGGATYTVEFEYACGPVGGTFTTAYPVVFVDPSQLVGRVWDVDLVAGTMVEPANSAGLFSSFFDHSVQLEVLSAAGASASVRWGGGVGGAQDTCLVTSDSGGDLSANPDLSVGPADVDYDADVLPFDLLGATLEGSVRGDGDLLVDTVLTATVDTRPMVEPMFGATAAQDELCKQVATLGDACVPCPTGGTFCLEVRIEGSPAVDVGVALEPRDQAEVDADPTC